MDITVNEDGDVEDYYDDGKRLFLYGEMYLQILTSITCGEKYYFSFLGPDNIFVGGSRYLYDLVSKSIH